MQFLMHCMFVYKLKVIVVIVVYRDMHSLIRIIDTPTVHSMEGNKLDIYM